jgi:hypothetical protein
MHSYSFCGWECGCGVRGLCVVEVEGHRGLRRGKEVHEWCDDQAFLYAYERLVGVVWNSFAVWCGGVAGVLGGGEKGKGEVDMTRDLWDGARDVRVFFPPFFAGGSVLVR